jgi:S1-C subfamily serine protease
MLRAAGTQTKLLRLVRAGWPQRSRVAAAAAAASFAAAAYALRGDRALLCEAAHPTPSYLTANFIADAAATASPALVNISVGGRGPFQPSSSGSGFIVEEGGLVLTNTHVVQQAMLPGGGGTVTVTLSDGVTRLKGTVQHADTISDIAIVRVQARKPLPTVALGSSADLRPGECGQPDSNKSSVA